MHVGTSQSHQAHHTAPCHSMNQASCSTKLHRCQLSWIGRDLALLSLVPKGNCYSPQISQIFKIAPSHAALQTDKRNFNICSSNKWAGLTCLYEHVQWASAATLRAEQWCISPHLLPCRNLGKHVNCTEIVCLIIVNSQNFASFGGAASH